MATISWSVAPVTMSSAGRGATIRCSVVRGTTFSTVDQGATPSFKAERPPGGDAHNGPRAGCAGRCLFHGTVALAPVSVYAEGVAGEHQTPEAKKTWRGSCWR